MAATSIAPTFRLLIHGKDGSVPYLTPELVRRVFCADGGGDDWKWRRRHLVLGVAAKDTAVTTVYRDASSTSKKKKGKNNVREGGASVHQRADKRARSEATGAPSGDASASAPATAARPIDADAPSPAKAMGAKKEDGGEIKHPSENGNGTAKKPSGYAFLTPSQSSQICAATSSCIGRRDRDERHNGYLNTHLRIPPYISTMIVPTFSHENPISNNKILREGQHRDKKKKYAPKKQRSPSTQKQQSQPRKSNDVTPNSTKDTMPVDTPHGWQKLTPEQYSDAIISLSRPSVSSSSEGSSCMGAVGLFDHIGIPREHLTSPFAPTCIKDQNDAQDGDGNSNGGVTATPAGLKAMSKSSLRRLAQRTNDWSDRTRLCLEREQSTNRGRQVDFWTPVHMALSYDSLFNLPHSAMPQNNGTNDSTVNRSTLLKQRSHVAIVGWDAIKYGREHRCRALKNAMNMPGSGPKPQYLVLAVNDLYSILDAALCGVAIIGTDLVRQWSRNGTAMCLNLAQDGCDTKSDDSDNTTTTVAGSLMDLTNEKYARDSLPLLPDCKCLTCSPRRISNSHHSYQKNSSSGGEKEARMVPSFTRAYIHHLIKAKEMVAETLLFVHNLHQMLLLFRQLSEIAALDWEENKNVDDCQREERHLQRFCQMIESQLNQEPAL